TSRASDRDPSGSEIALEIGADALEHRDVRLRRNKAFAGDRLEHADIDLRRLADDLARDRRDRVAIGVAACGDPAAEEILVEAVGRLAVGEPGGIARGEPVAAAVRGVDLVGEYDVAGAVEAELVFGVD